MPDKFRDYNGFRDEVWKKIHQTANELKKSKGYRKTFLYGKFEAYKEVWKLMGKKVMEENEK